LGQGRGDVRPPPRPQPGNIDKGVGKQLMAFAADLAEEKGCYKLQLLSGPNEDQVGFYRSLGMRDGTCRGFKQYFVERG